MKRANDKMRTGRGTTLVELTVATAIMAVVFAAVVPLFAGVRNSAESRWASLEMVQNARVLNEQLCRCLAGAGRVVTASGSTSDDGYIEFIASDGMTYRCAREANGYIAYGPVGDLHRLAGPVERLRFACYDGNDFDTSMSDPNGARLVTWEAELRSNNDATADKTVTGACYLRTGVHGASGSETYSYDCTQPGVLFAIGGQGTPQVRSIGSMGGFEYYLLYMFDAHDYTQIESDNGVRHTASATVDNYYAQLWLYFTIEQDKSDVTEITATWNGRGINTGWRYTDGASLYIWNYQTSKYELLQESANTETEVTLAGSQQDNASRYVGGSGDHVVLLLVVSNDRKARRSDNQLLSDYVKIDVTTGTGAGALLP